MFVKKRRLLEHILVVEDEPLVAFDAEYSLADAGFSVIATTDSVAEAIAYLGGSILPQLVVLDLGLRDGSGLDVAAAATGLRIPILFTTGQELVNIPALGIAVLGKPYNPRDLVAAIEVCERIVSGEKPKAWPQRLHIFPSSV